MKSPGVEPDLKIVTILDLGDSGWISLGCEARVVPNRFFLGNTRGLEFKDEVLGSVAVRASTTASRSRLASSSSVKSSKLIFARICSLRASCWAAVRLSVNENGSRSSCRCLARSSASSCCWRRS